MKDDEILRSLREAAREADEAPLPSPYDQPLGELFATRITRQILAEQAPAPARAKSRRPLWLAAPIAGGLAAAAAALLLVRAPKSPTQVDLPSYSLSVTGGLDSARSEGPAHTAARAKADGALTVLLRPAKDVRTPVRVTLASLRAGVAGAAKGEVRASPTGSVEINGVVGELVGPSLGDATLVVVVAPDGATIDAIAVAKGVSAPSGVAVARVAVTVVP